MRVLLLLFFTLSLFGASLTMPSSSFTSSGAVRDLVVFESKLYSATDVGVVDIFDVMTKQKLSELKVKSIKDFMGDVIKPKIYSVDVLPNQVLILSQGSSGFANLSLFTGTHEELLITSDAMLSIAKAKFIDANTILLALLSNELILYDIKTKEMKYQIQVTGSKFSDFALNEKKDEVVVADESGVLHLYRVSDAKLLKTFKGQNLDNVFQVQRANGFIATAGQDRRLVVYDTKKNSAYYKTSSFLIYTVALSPSTKYIAFSSDEHNTIKLFDRATQKELDNFGGTKMTPSKILFLNETEFLVSSDDRIINLYKIK